MAVESIDGQRMGVFNLNTDTDAEGRFELTNLPERDIRLMAYVRRPGATSIDFPASVEAGRNQTEDRIVIDPRLSAEAPEL